MGATVFLVLIGSSLLWRSGQAAPSPLPVVSKVAVEPGGEVWLGRMKRAGLSGDRSQIPNMVAAFQSPPDIQQEGVAFNIRGNLLHPLALLGATEALPALDEVIQSDPLKPFPGESYADSWENEQIIALSKAVRARIVAQSSAQGIADNQARASAEVQRFFQELGETPESLNAAVSAYETQDRQHLEASRLVSDVRHLPVPVSLAAVRELADMAYHDPYRGFAALPDVAKVDFSQDDGAALKIRLAPLSREQRIKTLVEELSQQEMEDSSALRRAQLLVDEGTAALPAIAAKQQDVEAHREHYRGKLGFLFGGLSTLDDAQAEIAAIDVAVKAQMGIATPNAVAPNGKPFKPIRAFQFAPGY